MKTTTKPQSKSGAASMFVVIFTTLLLGVITLSFVRIMLSEANQTTNYDLSQSAYDSALAGIEDAKVALLKYQECLNTNSGSQECKDAKDAMDAESSSENCDIISDILNRPNDGTETIIQSEESTTANETAKALEQAYTCVKIGTVNDDYLSALSQTYRSKMVPIRTDGRNSEIASIELQWFNSSDESKVSEDSDTRYSSKGSGTLTGNHLGYSTLTSKTQNDYNFSESARYPSVLQFQLFQTSANSSGFLLSDFDTNSGANTDRGTLLLRPSSSGTNAVANSGSVGLAASSDKSINNPVDIKCATGTYQCSVKIDVPRANGATPSAARSENNTFLRLALPYNAPETSFSIKLLDKNGNVIPFVGVQARVDATGRANDLFRRVEARLEMVDVYYPYPEYSASLSGEGDDTINKNFYVTQNCWTADGNKCANYGSAD